MGAYFDKMSWLPDRMLMNDLVFRLQYYKNDATWELGDDCLLLIKNKLLMDSYKAYFGQKSGFTPSYIFELGMFSGGSIALWHEIFQPKKIVGADLRENKENDYFRRYIAQNGLSDRIKTYWKTNQADTARLRQIALAELPEGIDLVFDDASHMYEATKQSFEALFPLLRPGGLYIIEDWNWSHSAACQREDSIWRDKIELTRLIFDLAEAVGSSSSAYISSLQVFDGYAVVEKSGRKFDPGEQFRLERIISRRQV
ncbi:Mycinamicin VI 2''-O-methyltransferase [Paenibacillus konkukensis]|uniref:Mycinamicin VI 2''-O-methyltransferase n=2 Tax=Paenibacillus konkukensis TaxID=2020716 RepID=A0ABY4RWP8_9BACL|nr:Mycinamicin VI 2''-O-methyltransferase [Paenibacillus konkukensis]